MRPVVRLALAATAVLLACLAAGCSTVDPNVPAGHFVQREVTFQGNLRRYQVYVPAHLDPSGATPIILFLHGSGERGNDGKDQTRAGLGNYLRKAATDFPAIVVFPQSPRNRSWDGDVADMAFATLDAASAEFGGDPARTYLTGMSRGGYGTWGLALMQPDRFAALVSVCGGLTSPPDEPGMSVGARGKGKDPYASTAETLKGVPVWLFHGAEDDIVPPQESRKIFAAFKAAGGTARYTEFPDANHNSWDAAYATPELWAWLLAQKKPG